MITLHSHAKCHECGYRLKGLSTTRCPECGRTFDPADSTTYDVEEEQSNLAKVLRHWLLFLIVALLVSNLVHLISMIRSNYSGDKFGNIIISLTLLFNYLAFSCKQKGVWSVVLQWLAWTWLAVTCGYVFFMLKR